MQLACPAGSESTLRDFYGRVLGFEEVTKPPVRLRAAGAPVLFDGDFPGMRRFYSEGPHGNRLELLEPAAGG